MSNKIGDLLLKYQVLATLKAKQGTEKLTNRCIKKINKKIDDLLPIYRILMINRWSGRKWQCERKKSMIHHQFIKEKSTQQLIMSVTDCDNGQIPFLAWSWDFIWFIQWPELCSCILKWLNGQNGLLKGLD